MPEIKLEGLTKKFGQIVALDDVTAEVKDGEYAVVVGPSGCGKTTLLKVIAGLHKPDSGRVFIDGVDVTDIPPEERGIGFFFQNYSLFPHMTVRENVGYGLKVNGTPQKECDERVNEMLEMVGLSEWAEHRPKHLSGGMQQRVALARALSLRLRILLLDEPLSALDARIDKMLRESLLTMAKKLGSTVVHVTPNQEEAMEMAEKVILMRHGRIVQAGSDFEVYNNPKKPFAAYFIGESNFLPARRVGKASVRWNGLKIEAGRSIVSDRVLLAIRSERVAFERKTKNTFEGVIENVNFLGKTSRYEVDVGGKTIIVQTAKHPELKHGDKVPIHLPPNDITVFEDFDSADYKLTFD